MVEFGDKCDAALGQAVNLLFPILRRLARLSGFLRERAAHLGDSRGHFAQVLAIDRDCFPVVVQHAIGHCRREGAKGFGRNAC